MDVLSHGKDRTDEVRTIAPEDFYKSGKPVLTWSDDRLVVDGVSGPHLTGPVGPTGATGATGSTGPAGADGALIKVGSVTVGTDTTQVDFTGLTGQYDYVLVGRFMGNGASGKTMYLLVNDDSTIAHYRTNSSQLGNVNYPVVHYVGVLGGRATAEITRTGRGYFAWTATGTLHSASDTVAGERAYGVKTDATITEITSLSIKAVDTLGIKAGSNFTLYKRLI